jgi:hypothetical protein
MSQPQKRRKRGMSPLEYAEAHTVAEITRVCVAAGTSYEYWKRIRDRRQRPSFDLALALEVASGGVLRATDLMFAKESKRGVGSPPIRQPRIGRPRMTKTAP